MCVQIYNYCTDIKWGDSVSPRIGRPPKENPKDLRIYVRMDKETLETLDQCADSLNMNRSEVVRKGIQKVKEEVDKNKN